MMQINEKINIWLYLTAERNDYYILSNCLVLDFDNPDLFDGYTYILPRKKASFEFRGQDQELLVFVEKIDEKNKTVYVSQTNWLYMKNIIAANLFLDVKIKKRYPGKLTLAELRTPGQRIDKESVKALSEKIKEKIFIKQPKFI